MSIRTNSPTHSHKFTATCTMSLRHKQENAILNIECVKWRIPSLQGPPAQIRRYGTKSLSPTRMESLTQTWQGIIWKMTFLSQICRICNHQCRAHHKSALLIVHSCNGADGYVLKTTKPLTRISQVSGSVCIRFFSLGQKGLSESTRPHSL